MKHLLLVLALTCTACASAPPNLTPQATTAFYAHRAEDGLDQVRNVAQSAAAQAPPLVSQVTANAVTRWHLAAIRTLHSAPQGYQAAILTGLDETVRALPASEQAVLAPYVALAKTLIQELH